LAPSRRARRVLLEIGIASVACVVGCGSPQGAQFNARALCAPDATVPTSAASDAVETAIDPAHDLSGDFADPFVLRGAGAYYAFATGAQPLHLQVARSRDLAAWTLLGEALPELPAWALKAPGLTWAPSALARRDRYVLYYTTRDAVSGFQCISRALSSTPEGPYIDDSSQPLVCQVAGSAPFCGSIDPSPFLDSDGRPFLLWKSDENSARCRTAPRIWAQALTDDGLSLVGPAQTLLAVDQRWEDTIIEAPSMVLYGGRYLLFYSGNHYDSGNYAIGYATCPNLFGLCTKATLGMPYLTSAGSMSGPGGQELFQDGEGAVWMAYHAWTSPKTSYGAGGTRSLRLARMTFGPEGNPRPMLSP
jgi:beta-xylosidase